MRIRIRLVEVLDRVRTPAAFCVDPPLPRPESCDWGVMVSYGEPVPVNL